MENEFDAEELKNIVYEFMYNHNLMEDYKKYIDKITHYAMIIDSPEPRDKWERNQDIINLENTKGDFMIAALYDERVPCSDLYDFSDEFNHYMSRIWRHK